MPNRLELKNKVFGDLTVISLAHLGQKKKPESYWNVECSCGVRFVARGAYLTSGKTHCCVYCTRFKAQRVEFVGKRFQSLVCTDKLKKGRKIWLIECICDCGGKKWCRLSDLKRGRIKSCGCMWKANYTPFIGKTIGNWTITGFAPANAGRRQFFAICKCGTQSKLDCWDITHRKITGKSGTWGCGKRTCNSNFEDLTGQQFGDWTAIKLSINQKHKRFWWKCVCKCGTLRDVLQSNLKKGISKSCGCSTHQRMSQTKITKNCPKELLYKEIYRSYKSSAETRNFDFNLDFNTFKQLLSQNCNYCDKPPSNKRHLRRHGVIQMDLFLEYTGIDRVDTNKGYFIENVVPCCKNCNMKKSNLPANFILKIAEFLNNQKKEVK